MTTQCVSCSLVDTLRALDLIMHQVSLSGTPIIIVLVSVHGSISTYVETVECIEVMSVMVSVEILFLYAILTCNCSSATAG